MQKACVIRLGVQSFVFFVSVIYFSFFDITIILLSLFLAVYSSVHHLTEHNGVDLFGWVSQVTGEPVTGFQRY